MRDDARRGAPFGMTLEEWSAIRDDVKRSAMAIAFLLSSPRKRGSRARVRVFPISGAVKNVGIQVTPRRIDAFDELQLPLAVPALDGFFARDRGRHGRVLLEPHQPMHAVVLRVAGYLIVLVLPNASGQVAGDADVERAVAMAGEDVDAGIFHAVRNVRAMPHCGLIIVRVA